MRSDSCILGDRVALFDQLIVLACKFVWCSKTLKKLAMTLSKWRHQICHKNNVIKLCKFLSPPPPLQITITPWLWWPSVHQHYYFLKEFSDWKYFCFLKLYSLVKYCFRENAAKFQRRNCSFSRFCTRLVTTLSVKRLVIKHVFFLETSRCAVRLNELETQS